MELPSRWTDARKNKKKKKKQLEQEKYEGERERKTDEKLTDLIKACFPSKRPAPPGRKYLYLYVCTYNVHTTYTLLTYLLTGHNSSDESSLPQELHVVRSVV